MSNTFVPFNFNPTNVFSYGSGVYTVPANKFARVMLVSPDNGGGELYLKKSGNTETYLNTSVTTNVPFGSFPITQATHTLLTISSGYKYTNTRIFATISSSNGNAIFAWTGTTPAAGNLLTIPQNSSNDTGTIAVVYTGPGTFTLQNQGAGNTNYSAGGLNGYLYRSTESFPSAVDDSINPATIAGEVWLSAGDEISFEGGLVINEYDQPS